MQVGEPAASRLLGSSAVLEWLYMLWAELSATACLGSTVSNCRAALKSAFCLTTSTVSRLCVIAEFSPQNNYTT